MHRRWKFIGRIVFHGGALISLIVATVVGGMWFSSVYLIGDGCQWIAVEKKGELNVRQDWNVGVNRGFLLVHESRVVTWLPEVVPAEMPRSSQFLHRDDGPYLPPLLPTAASEFHHGCDVQSLLPWTSLATGYKFSALVSTRKRDLFMAGDSMLSAGEWSTPYRAGREWGMMAPLWIFLVGFSIWPICWEFLYRRGLYRKARQRWRRERNLCVACGYDLRGSTERCPECGLATGTPAAARGT